MEIWGTSIRHRIKTTIRCILKTCLKLWKKKTWHHARNYQQNDRREERKTGFGGLFCSVYFNIQMLTDWDLKVMRSLRRFTYFEVCYQMKLMLSFTYKNQEFKNSKGCTNRWSSVNGLTWKTKKEDNSHTQMIFQDS